MVRSPRSLLRPALLIVLAVLVLPTSIRAQSPALVVLTETGSSSDGLPVLRAHPDGRRIAASFARGFPARLLRIYQLEQAYLAARGGARPEPAYLLLSSRQGGFPVVGFWLEGQDKRRVAFVDLHKGGRLVGQFGAMDQIFPHELVHVMVRQLAGDPRRGGSNQMHAVGVCTDPMQAFSEGFAEHAQIMALDDPDADPATRSLLGDPFWRLRMERELDQYRRELGARWAPAARRRMTFPLWFSGNESVLRYYGVKANQFAREPAVPDRLIDTSDPYGAYLFENILPGRPGDRVKPLARLLSTEGVVAALFWRWATSPVLQNAFGDETFYARFGTRAADVAPPINVYLKLLHVLHEAKPDTTVGLVDAYRRMFPAEAPEVDRIVAEVLQAPSTTPPPAIWLANPDSRVGTTVFDQWRAAPRVRTFDLNAASVGDLASVPGVDAPLARRLAARLPVERIGDLRGVTGFTPQVEGRFEAMAAAMGRVAAEDEGESVGKLATVFWAYARRAAALWLLAAAPSVLVFRRLGRLGWRRAWADALAASLLTLAAGWITWPSFTAAFAAASLFGLPAAAIAGWRGRSWRRSGRALASWLVASAPAWLLLTPLG